MCCLWPGDRAEQMCHPLITHLQSTARMYKELAITRQYNRGQLCSATKHQSPRLLGNDPPNALVMGFPWTAVIFQPELVLAHGPSWATGTSHLSSHSWAPDRKLDNRGRMANSQTQPWEERHHRPKHSGPEPCQALPESMHIMMLTKCQQKQNAISEYMRNKLKKKNNQIWYEAMLHRNLLYGLDH